MYIFFLSPFFFRHSFLNLDSYLPTNYLWRECMESWQGKNEICHEELIFSVEHNKNLGWKFMMYNYTLEISVENLSKLQKTGKEPNIEMNEYKRHDICLEWQSPRASCEFRNTQLLSPNFYSCKLVTHEKSWGTVTCFRQRLESKPPQNGPRCSEAKWHVSLCVCVGKSKH
jgi:hypothetical protein